MRCPRKKAQKREQRKALGDVLTFLSEWMWEDGKKIKKQEWGDEPRSTEKIVVNVFSHVSWFSLATPQQQIVALKTTDSNSYLNWKFWVKNIRLLNQWGSIMWFFALDSWWLLVMGDFFHNICTYMWVLCFNS